jgi:hypothetical protein
MAIQPTTLYDVANDILVSAINSLNSCNLLDPLDARPAPERAYVAFCEPVNDCEQLTVHGDNLTPYQDRIVCNMPSKMEFTITIFRCYPLGVDDNGNVIPATDLDAASRALYVDLWCIYTGLLCDYSQGDLFSTVSNCDNLEINQIRCIGPDGGFAGWEITVTVDVSSSLI